MRLKARSVSNVKRTFVIGARDSHHAHSVLRFYVGVPFQFRDGACVESCRFRNGSQRPLLHNESFGHQA
ncbi:hypothetical protein [Noviherbaspirillum sp.]|uniref:hypothetical protein n=1 Tax=Noviherbaspirillum sp. TaxID=1926288 RepID=UPI002B488BCD|nr:hypothetical protein [Noviherbaspirillum sp.]